MQVARHDGPGGEPPGPSVVSALGWAVSRAGDAAGEPAGSLAGQIGRVGIVLLAMSAAVIWYTAMTGAPQSPDALQLSVPVRPGKSVVA